MAWDRWGTGESWAAVHSKGSVCCDPNLQFAIGAVFTIQPLSSPGSRGTPNGGLMTADMSGRPASETWNLPSELKSIAERNLESLGKSWLFGCD